MRTLCLFLLFLLVAPKVWADDDWNTYKGYHFIIYYKKAPQDFVKSVDESAERYYDEITRNLGFTRYKSWTWEERAQIFIYDSQDDYIENAKTSGWSHGVAYPNEKIIRTFPSAHGFFDSTLPHELGHIIFREFIGPRALVPLWFEEGVAMYQEKAKRWGANDAVNKAIEEGNFIPLQDLTKMRLYSASPKELVELFYTEAASAVYFLISEFGEYRFVNFCRKLKEGDSFEDAMESVYVRIKNFEQYNKLWLDYLR